MTYEEELKPWCSRMLHLICFLWISTTALLLAAVTPAKGEEKQEVFTLKSKGYDITCTEKVKGNCNLVLEMLRSAQKYRDQKQKEEKKQEIQSGALIYDEI